MTTEFGMGPGQDPGPLPTAWAVDISIRVIVPMDERMRQDLIDVYNRELPTGQPTVSADDFVDSDTGEFDASEFGFWLLNNREVSELDGQIKDMDYDVWETP